jgi:hypothetical protein
MEKSKKPALTNAQRQAAYREKHLKSEDGTGERLNVVIDVHAKKALERLAVYYGVTNKTMLERLVLGVQAQLLAKFDGDRQNDYYDGKLTASKKITA